MFKFNLSRRLNCLWFYLSYIFLIRCHTSKIRSLFRNLIRLKCVVVPSMEELCDIFHRYGRKTAYFGVAARQRRWDCTVYRIPRAYAQQWGRRPITFISGVFLADLSFWRRYHIQERAFDLLSQNQRRPLWRIGSNPPLCILFANSFYPIDRRWHVFGLGNDRNISTEMLKNAYILHWNGKHKQWEQGGLWKSLWYQ